MPAKMLVVTLIVVYLSPAIQARQACPATSKCSSSDAAILPVSPYDLQKHYYLGGMFGLHDTGKTPYDCGDIRERGIQNLEMFLYTIQKYPTQSTIKIGGIAFDSCSRQEQIIEKLMSFEKCSTAYHQDGLGKERIDPRLVLTYVGPDRSGEAIATGEILGDMSKVQISHAATTAKLNDKLKYPYFLRTAQSNDNEVRAILQIMRGLSFGFTLVVYSGNVYGKDLYEVFKSEASTYGVCLVKSEQLPTNKDDAVAYNALVDRLLQQKVVYSLVVLANDDYATVLLNHIGQRQEAGAFAIFGTSSWGNKRKVIEGANKAADGAVTIGMKPSTADISDFKNHFKSLKPSTNTENPWFQEYWESRFQCNLGSNTRYSKLCNESQQELKDIEFDAFLPNTKLAVEAALAGIERSINKSCNRDVVCSYFLNEKPGYKIYKQTSTVEMNGKLVFNTTTGGTAQWRYELYNIAGGRYLAVGTYTSDNGLVLTTNILNYDRKSYSLKPSCPLNTLCCGRSSEVTPSTTTQTTVSPKIGPSSKLYAVYFDNDTAITGARRTGKRESYEYRTRFDLGQNWIIALGVLAGLGIVIVIVLELYIMYKVIPVRENRQILS